MSALACIVYATFPDRTHAEQTARALVDGHLVACCNLLPGIESFYWWEGALQQSSEVAMIAKTTEALAASVIARIAALHPYENPAILQLPVSGGAADFLAWVASTVLPADAVS